MSFTEDVTRHSVHTLVFRSLKRTHDMFLSDVDNLPPPDGRADEIWKKAKARSIYGPVMDKVEGQKSRGQFGQNAATLALEDKTGPARQAGQVALYAGAGQGAAAAPGSAGAQQQQQQVGPGGVLAAGAGPNTLRGPAELSGGTALQVRKPMTMPKPNWHAPWKLYRVISGHTGWVR